MSRLAVIATLYGQRAVDNLPRIVEAMAGQTRLPDEVWWITENVDSDGSEMVWMTTALDLVSKYVDLPTPRDESGHYAVIPYSAKINHALDRTKADYITYLTDDSWPAPAKYERMAAALDEHPEWGAVYCGQDFGGGNRMADCVMEDAHCRVDHTQVMHRLTADRWPLEVADITLGDAIFWRRLHASLGPFYPVNEVLDFVRQTNDGISGGNRG